MVKVQIHFDLIAPWCFLIKRRLEEAIARLGRSVAIETEWLPFELNPAMPLEGMNRRTYRAGKLGSWQMAQSIDAQFSRSARDSGLHFHLDRIERVPNTLDFHRLVSLAIREQVQNQVLESFFRAYYIEGRDLTKRTNLIKIAVDAGLDPLKVSRLLQSEEGIAEVREKRNKALDLGIHNVPHMRFNGVTSRDGAFDTASIMSVLKKLGHSSAVTIIGLHRPPADLTREQHGFTRTSCDCDFCKVFCRHVPGRLDVSDLSRLCPEGKDIFAWSEVHLRAVSDSPFPKLVPARQESGHCHWFADGRCAVHRDAPYGCAFFDSHMTVVEVQARSRAANLSSEQDASACGIYARVWRHLCEKGLTHPSGLRGPLDEEMRRIRVSMDQN